jgi:predicted transcriptional regulator
MNKDDKVQTVNQKTGEKKDGYFVYIAYPKPKITGNRWMMTFQDSLAIIAEDKELTGETLRVFMLALSELEFENYITIKQVAIAEKLGMQKTHVSRAMKLLVTKGIILKVKEGTTTGYKLNPHYGWKGKVSNRDIELKRIAKQRVVDIKKYRDVTETPSK